MKPFFALIGVSFKNLLLTSVNFGKGKRKAASGIGAFIFMAILMLYLSGTYSVVLASQLAPFGGLNIMLMYMLLVATFAPLIFTFYAAQSLVFSTKDMDLVLSLPIPTLQVMLARIMALYLEVLLITETLLLPAGIAYAAFGGSGGVATVFLLMLLGLFLALVPTLIGLICGYVISWVMARIRFKNLVMTLLSFLFMGGIFVASFGINGVINGVLANVQQALAAIPLPIAWVIDAVTRFSPLHVLLVAVLCLVPFLLVAWLFSLHFKQMLTGLASTALKNDYKLVSLKTTGPFMALLGKEAGKFFGTPILLLNSGFGVLLAIGASIFAVFNRGAISAFLASIAGVGGGALAGMVAPGLLLALAFTVSTVLGSAVSISLEGKTLWILKESAVPVSTIFMAKAGFNFLLEAATCVLSIPLLGIAFSLPAVQVACLLLVCLLYAALTSMVGLFVNLLFPRLDAENDAIVVKQSASVIISMLADWVLGGALVGVYFLLSLVSSSFVVFALVASVVLFCMAGGMVLLLNTKGKRLFAEL